MLIFIILWLITALLLLRNFHKILIIYVPFSILLTSAFSIRYSSPVLSISTAVNLQIVITYFLEKKLNFIGFPFKSSFKFYIFVIVLSFLFTHVNYDQAFTNTIGLLLPLLVCIIFYKEFSSRRDFKIFHRSMIIVSCIFISYGIFEYFLQFNPILFFLKSYIEIEGSSLVIFLTDENNIRFGSIRCQSLFMHSISYGTCCVLFILYYLYTIKECQLKYTQKLITIILIPILFFCLITSGSRSPMVGLLIGLTAIFNKHTLKKSLGLSFSILCVILILSQFGFLDVFLSLISSLVDTNNDEVSGSSIDLRLLQLKTCFIAISSNPIIGLGARGGEYAYYKLQLYDLAGLESCWFHTLINQGLLGCCALIYIYYSLYRYARKKCKYYSFETSIILCFLIINTMTSIPEVGIEKLLFIFIVMMNYKKENDKLKQATTKSQNLIT